MRPMLGEPVFATVMVTIGLAVILRLVDLIWDAYPLGLRRRLRRPASSPLRRAVLPAQIGLLVALALLRCRAWAFFRYSKIGIAMRAVAADERPHC